MSFHAQIPFVVVQCPSHSDAEFASRGLAAAVDADRILANHRNANPEFEVAIGRLGLITPTEFSWPALEVTRVWLNSGFAFSLNLGSEMHEAFAYMTGAGFFTRTDEHYRMTHPDPLTPETVARALLQLAETEDEDDDLHPEWLLTTMTHEEAHRNVSVIENLELLQRTDSFLEVLH
jgi:hypothetical protein